VPAVSNAFERLHERVRRWVWQEKWDQLRDVQEQAIEPILSGSKDVIIMAATAAGKTEAAFLPICSRLTGDAGGSVRALYVGPLKALINDQFQRLDRLCEHLEIPVHRWHGDVQAGAKQSLLKTPSGVLLITPESLEALFVNRGTHISRIFGGLEFVVIDELHAFIGNERGRQLQSLLHRLEIAIRKHVPRIALSATLGDTDIAAKFLRPRMGADVTVITSSGDGRELKMQVRGYRATAPALSRAEQRTAEKAGHEVQLEEVTSGDKITISEHLFTTLRGRDNLIFANARTAVEEYADLLRRMSEKQHVPNEFFPHHGNLSKELREDVERLLKDRNRPLNAVCTSTLELGIDIGSVHSIAQIGAPPSVAAMRQRLGRSGRKAGEASILRLYVVAEEVTDSTAPQDTIHPELVQSIAMLNLLLAKWYEPPATGALHLSTLVQQVLSLIAQHGGITAKDAWEVLCKSGPFGEVDARMFAEFLRGLGAHDLIAQAADGTLLPGGVGERIINHYSFYTAFTTPEEYRLVSDGRTLGTLPIDYPVAEGQFLIFAGRRWRVTRVEPEQKVIDLVPAPGGRPPQFGGTGISVHDNVRQEMLKVYRSGDIPIFLDAGARGLLTEARANFARLGLVENEIIASGDQALLFPWMGSRVMNTLFLQLQQRGVDACLQGLAIAVDRHTPDQLRDLLRQVVAEGPADGAVLAAQASDQLLEKYDRFLPERLLAIDYASRQLDPVGAWSTARRIADGAPERRQPAKVVVSMPTGVVLADPPVLWNAADWIDGIGRLPTVGPLPARTVLVPRERVAHALRRELVRSGRSDTLIGTRFISPTMAAVEVLVAAGVEFSEGEEALRPVRLRHLFEEGIALQHFPLALLRETLGWDEAFAQAIDDLERAAVRPEELPADQEPQLIDLRTVWQAVDGLAERSWTDARILLEAAVLLERDSGAWPFAGAVLATASGETSAAEARFVRAIPDARIALHGGRPLREQYLERVGRLFGGGAVTAVQSAAPERGASTERDLLAAYLFERPDLLADPDRPRSGGPDGTVHFEEHPGVDAEIEAAADWVARQVFEHRTPLEDIAVLIPAIDPLAGLVVDRLRRLPWPEGVLPICVAGGLPLTGCAAGARVLATVRALRQGLAVEPLADLLPAIRTGNEDRRHLARGAALDLAYALGCVGGSTANLRGGLTWDERAERREADLSTQLARAREQDNDEDRSRAARTARDLERLLTDLRAVRPGLATLVDVLCVVVDGARLPEIWERLRTFLSEWLLLGGPGAAAADLLDGALQAAVRDPNCGALVGADALELIERTLVSIRLPEARFGEPAVYVGTLRGAVGLPFQAVRVMGLSEGVLAGISHENPVLPDTLRRQLPWALTTAADHVLADLHALDHVVRDTRGSVVLSAPRVGVGGSEREASSIFVEAAAAVGRPNLISKKRIGPIPDAVALRRDCFTPGRTAADEFRLATPLSEAAWEDRVAVEHGGIPTAWRGSSALDLDGIRSLVSASGWTALDGAIGAGAVGTTLPGLTAERPISASRLRTLLQCPHRFLFESVIGWSEPSSPPPLREIDALAYGSLFHRVAESFFRQHGTAFGERRSTLPEWRRLADTMVDAAFAGFCEEYPLVGESVRNQQRERLRRDVHAFLEYDWGPAVPRTFVAVERAFGTGASLALRAGAGELYVQGYIDRIDVESGRTLVRDLKSGRSHPRRGKEVDADPSRDLQIAVYGLVTRQLAPGWGIPPVIEAAYVYAGAHGEPERAFRSDFDQLAAVAGNWLATGAGLLAERIFPRTPESDDCGYCPFQPVCGRRPTDRSAQLLAGSDGVLGQFRNMKEGTGNESAD
jgi:superfamily II DNA/RNA helicase